MKPVMDVLLNDDCKQVAACRIVRGKALAAPVIFTSPHSGSHYPTSLQDRLQVPLIDLRRTEDAYIDDLISTAPDKNLILIAANYARCYVDLNRDARELDASMFSDGAPRTCGMPSARVRAGLGCLPRVGASGREIYSDPLSRKEGADRLDRVYDGYHGALTAELEALKLDWSDVVMIDCHSMPSVQPGRSTLPDIVLGDRFGSSCSGRLTSVVERTFRRLGLSVVRNAPYAGGYTTRRYGRPRRGVHLLQIEINRKLYLDEVLVEKSTSFEDIKHVMAEIIDEIAAYTLRENG